MSNYYNISELLLGSLKTVLPELGKMGWNMKSTSELLLYNIISELLLGSLKTVLPELGKMGWNVKSTSELLLYISELHVGDPVLLYRVGSHQS